MYNLANITFGTGMGEYYTDKYIEPYLGPHL